MGKAAERVNIDEAISELRELAENSPRLPDAHWQHNAICGILTAHGWKTRSEAGTEYNDGVYWRRGRVDLDAEKGGFTVAIEIDRRRPRTKSILKLRAIHADARIVLLREPGWEIVDHPGIDAVICIGTQRGLGRT